MKEKEPFSYWKYSYQKWMILIVGILQVICLILNIQEYQKVEEAAIFSGSKWSEYAAQQILQCLIHGILAVEFLGIFGIGILVRSRKSAHLWEGILTLLIAVVWGVTGLWFSLTSSMLSAVIWIVFLVLASGYSIFSFWRSRQPD